MISCGNETDVGMAECNYMADKVQGTNSYHNILQLSYTCRCKGLLIGVHSMCMHAFTLHAH